MSTFTINANKINNQNYIYKNSIKNIPSTLPINDFNNTKTSNITKIFQKKSINQERDIPKNNNRRNVRKNLDTSAVRQNHFNYFVGKFDQGFPLASNYPLCPQKISTVFQNGGLHWTQNTTNIGSSFPLGSNFIKVVDSLTQLSSLDCNCYYVDFSGNYLLNWTLESGGQLLSSDNPQVTIGTFNFYQSDEYFDIFLYPIPELNKSSYVHIRYRIPIRYRYVYEDWTFWESLLIDNTLSETEFVKVVDCCTQDAESLKTIPL